MSNSIGFFTAVKYEPETATFSEVLLEKVDHYFYLGGKKAQVIKAKTKNGLEKVTLVETSSSLAVRIGNFVSYFTGVVPLFMLITKAVLRSFHTFRLIDPKKKWEKKLEEGINLSEETFSKIRKLISKILYRSTDDELEWVSIGLNLVFKLKSNPELVFKIASPSGYPRDGTLPIENNEKTYNRFENMIKAKEVCVNNKLELLVLPQAKKFTINIQNKSYLFIAEKSLDIVRGENEQENIHYYYSKKLNETAQQLAVFIAKTGFNDVVWRNIPILNETSEYSGPRRIGLVDVEHMDNVLGGFNSDSNDSRGLIGCATSEEQIDIIISEACKQGVYSTSQEAQHIKQKRLDEFKADKELQDIYSQRGISTGEEPIQVDDLDSLNLDLTEEAEILIDKESTEEIGKRKWIKKTITVKDATEDVIAEINKCIGQNKNKASLKKKRSILLNTSKNPFLDYYQFKITSKKFPLKEENQNWLYRIILALIEKGHLYKLDKVDGYGYYIQA